MKRLVLLILVFFGLYEILSQPRITEEMGYISIGCGLIILVVIVSFLPGIRSKRGRVENRVVVAIHKKPRLKGFGWLFGYRTATISQQFRVDGDIDAVEEATGKQPDRYGWTPEGYVPKKDVNPIWHSIGLGAVGVISLIILVFLLALIMSTAI